MPRLTPEQLERRRKVIGGSDAPKIMKGKWHELWLEKTGREDPVFDDVSLFRMEVGHLTEELNIKTLEKNLGKPIEYCTDEQTYYHDTMAILACHPDGLIHEDRVVIDAKHTNSFMKPEGLHSSYFWQLLHNTICVGYDRGMISPIYGNTLGEPIWIDFDQDQVTEYLEAAAAFWWHVEQDIEPEDQDEKAAKIIIEEPRILFAEAPDCNFGPEFVELIETWADNKDAAKVFKDTESEAKAMMPDDGTILYTKTHGMFRNKAGSLSIKKLSPAMIKKHGLNMNSTKYDVNGGSDV